MGWKVLFIDDEVDVVEVARLTLDGLRYRGQAVEVLWANSAKAALKLLTNDEEIAVAFVDVSMEKENSGLDLIRKIRDQNVAWRTRFILLTGQTSLAPEASSTVHYDLDGYLDKATLTSERLFAATYSGIRTYDLVSRLDKSRNSVLQAVTTLSELDAQNGVARTLRSVISELINVGDELVPDASWSWQSESKKA